MIESTEAYLLNLIGFPTIPAQGQRTVCHFGKPVLATIIMTMLVTEAARILESTALGDLFNK